MDDLQKITWAILIPIAKELLHPDNVTVEYLEDYFREHVTVAIKAQIWSEEAGTYKHPVSWFEMFKQQHFPWWLLKRYPVRYKTVKFTCLYPNWSPAIKAQRFNVIVREIEEE
jgi:hypothetical protein